MRALVFLVVASALLIPSAAQNDEWRTQNRLRNRYEGVGYRVLQASPAVLNLISFVSLKERIDPQVAADLALEFYAGGAAVESVVARELGPIKNYRMEPFAPASGWAAGWNRFTGWNTADVLRPQGIPLSNVGVLVRLTDADPFREHIAPAVVRNVASTTNGPLVGYEAHFVSSVYLSGGLYEVFRGCGADALTSAPLARGVIGSRTANFYFPVTFSLAGASAGVHLLKVEVLPVDKTSDADPVAREYCFTHQPTWPSE